MKITKVLAIPKLSAYSEFNGRHVIVEPISKHNGTELCSNVGLLDDNSRIVQILMEVPLRWLKDVKETQEQDMFKEYRRVAVAELRPVTDEEIMTRKLDAKISVSPEDREKGHPFAGDMIARNPKNHDDQWLVAGAYFKENFEEMPK